MNIVPDLNTLTMEIAALESETFAIQDYTEISDLLSAAAGADSTSSSSTSTCSATTSTTSTCA